MDRIDIDYLVSQLGNQLAADIGLSLRDRFAAAALQGLLAAGEHHGRRDERGVIVSVADAHSLTRDAYALADEMLAARSDGNGVTV